MNIYGTIEWFQKRKKPEAVKELSASKEEVTGPCGCTLKIGEPVVVERGGRGKILARRNRILKVALQAGREVQIDQAFVHRVK